MLLNYLKLAFRILIRNPFLTFLNVLCLSIGFTVFIILWQYSGSELHADRFHHVADRIYRVGNIYHWLDSQKGWLQRTTAKCPAEVARQVAGEFEAIEDFTRIINKESFSNRVMHHTKDFSLSHVNEKGEKTLLKEDHFVYADPNIFSFFGLPVRSGNTAQFLNEPNSVVISEAFAENSFGNDGVVGKIIFINDSIPLRITGIFKNLPHNTHLKFQVVASTESIKRNLEASVWSGWAFTYYRMKPGTDISLFQQHANQYIQKRWGQRIKEAPGEINYELYTQPVSEVPFVRYEEDVHHLRSKQTLTFLHIIPVIILFMAWINYINLTISVHAKRVKELTARKTVGALRVDFIKQFLLETAVVNGIAILLCVTFIQIIRSPLELYLQFYTPGWAEIQPSTLLIILLVIVAGVTLTAVYPAWVTFQRTSKALVRSVTIKKNETLFGKILTGIQYTSAIVLIAWTFAAFKQISLLSNTDMGIDSKDVIIIDAPRTSENTGRNFDFFLERLSGIPGVRESATSNSVVGDNDWGWALVDLGEGTLQCGIGLNGGVDENYIPFYGLKLLAGRNFLPGNPADENAIIYYEPSHP